MGHLGRHRGLCRAAVNRRQGRKFGIGKSEFLHLPVGGFERTISTVYPACLRSAARAAAASVVAYSSATLPRRFGCVAHNDHLPGVPSGTIAHRAMGRG
jgi:hypothetical protein